jgi:hypothetical protein
MYLSPSALAERSGNVVDFEFVELVVFDPLYWITGVGSVISVIAHWLLYDEVRHGAIGY